MDRVGIRQEIGDEGVARFVDCRQALFLIADDMAAAFRTEADFFAGFFQFSHVDDFLISPGSQEGCFVEQVAQVGTGEARRLLGDDVEVDILAEGLAFGVDVEDSPAAAQVRPVDGDLPVETARTEKRRVEDIRTVGRSDGDDAFVGTEAIHFDQELVQCLFPFVMTAAKASTALAADGIDFVDEDDAGRILLGLCEQITDTGGTNADEHFDEVGTADAEEGDTGFAGYGTGQEGLAGPRRAEEEHPFGYLGANGIILAGVAQEFDDFRQFLLRFVFTSNVFKGNLDLTFPVHLGMALAKVHDPAAAALGLLHDEEPDGNEDQDWQDCCQHVHPPRRLFGRFGDDVDISIAQCRQECRIGRGIRSKRGSVFQLSDDSVIGCDLDGIDFFLLHLTHEIRVRNFRFICLTAGKGIYDRYGDDDDE